MPPTMPPIAWLCASIGLMILPRVVACVDAAYAHRPKRLVDCDFGEHRTVGGHRIAFVRIVGCPGLLRVKVSPAAPVQQILVTFPRGPDRLRGTSGRRRPKCPPAETR